MRGPDTGEFLALDIPEDQARLSAVEWKNEADKFKSAYERLVVRHHENSHRLEQGNYNGSCQFLACDRITCREARNLLSIGDRGGY